ncbi:MAG: phage major capsid protein [Candidatus Thiodiazotropha sp. (ex Ctena orbiculata)]|nr:phage major capsid protein [Candidatus Thiodiazotropha taylori]
MSELESVIRSIEAVEVKLDEMSEKAAAEVAAAGEIATETKAAIDRLGEQQRELADRLLAIEQRGVDITGGESSADSWGKQFVKSDAYGAFVDGRNQKMRMEVKNTVVGSDATVAPDRRPGVVAGAFQPLTLEGFLPSIPTTSNAIEFTREQAFVNNAAEVAEGGAKPESDITFELVPMPVSTVAHWVRISRQLASDNAALAAYIDLRIRYGVNRRVEGQLVAGDGAAPNLSGILNAGNYTAHGKTDAELGATLKLLVLIRKIIADCWVAGYAADAIILNPVDWAQIEIDLFTTAAGQTLFSIDANGTPRLFGLPVIQSIGMTSGQVAVGSFAQACMIHNREGVVVEMSESDADNFTNNLITLRAERRLALATEVPAAIRAGTLTPV